MMLEPQSSHRRRIAKGSLVAQIGNINNVIASDDRQKLDYRIITTLLVAAAVAGIIPH